MFVIASSLFVIRCPLLKVNYCELQVANCSLSIANCLFNQSTQQYNNSTIQPLNQSTSQQITRAFERAIRSNLFYPTQNLTQKRISTAIPNAKLEGKLKFRKPKGLLPMVGVFADYFSNLIESNNFKLTKTKSC